MFCLLVELVRLSVAAVQVIDCIEGLITEMTDNVLMGTLNPTHSVTQSPDQQRQSIEGIKMS